MLTLDDCGSQDPGAVVLIVYSFQVRKKMKTRTPSDLLASLQLGQKSID
jgi:hypothetical protein